MIFWDQKWIQELIRIIKYKNNNQYNPSFKWIYPSMRPCWVISFWASSRDSLLWNHGWATWIAREENEILWQTEGGSSGLFCWGVFVCWPMLDMELWEVDGLPWELSLWQLFLCRRREQAYALYITLFIIIFVGGLNKYKT